MAASSLPFDVHAEVLRARSRLDGEVGVTPIVPAPWLSERTGGEVVFKLENAQVTGSFKARGAANCILAMADQARARGVVTASSGNHGLGVARAAARSGVAATVFVPLTTPEPKVAAIAALGAEVKQFGEDCVDTEAHARALADQTGRVYVSPYNDELVIAGQGTISAELFEQWPEVERVYVAVGGGGLIGGMAGYAAAARPDVQWIGCSPSQSAAMAECVRRGAIVDVPCGETLSDSTHGGVEPGAMTYELCRQLVHRWIDVDEDAIRKAVLDCLSLQHQLVEGAAGVAVAACLADPEMQGRKAAVIICGGNLPMPKLRGILAATDAGLAAD